MVKFCVAQNGFMHLSGMSVALLVVGEEKKGGSLGRWKVREVVEGRGCGGR